MNSSKVGNKNVHVRGIVNPGLVASPCLSERGRAEGPLATTCSSFVKTRRVYIVKPKEGWGEREKEREIEYHERGEGAI